MAQRVHRIDLLRKVLLEGRLFIKLFPCDALDGQGQELLGDGVTQVDASEASASQFFDVLDLIFIENELKLVLG